MDMTAKRYRRCRTCGEWSCRTQWETLRWSRQCLRCLNGGLGIATPGSSCAASEVASLEPCSPLSSCSDGAEPRPPQMPPSQPAAGHTWHAPLQPPATPPRHKRRSRSQGDCPPLPAAASPPPSPETHECQERAAKRRRRASSDEHRTRPPPPLPPPPRATVAAAPRQPAKTHVQEKITEYFTKQIKHISSQAFRVMKKEFLGVRPVRPVLQLGDDTAEVPPSEGCDDRPAQRDAVLRTLKRRNGTLLPPATVTASVTASASASVCGAPDALTSAEKRARDVTSVKGVSATRSGSAVKVARGDGVTGDGVTGVTQAPASAPPSVTAERLVTSSAVVTSPEAEEASTACRTPSETSSVDSGLGKERVISEPGTPSEPAAEPAVRFPARDRATPSGALTCCRWLDCGDRLSSPTQLLDHLQSQHVHGPVAGSSGGTASSSSSSGSRSRRCLWQGCKVYDRPGSAAWLERHVLTHGGSKPFRCIVDGCSHRFASQSMLERHVNHHFNPPAPLKRAESCVKTARRTGRRAQLEEHPHSARIFDFCDPSAMERMRYQLVSADEALERLPPIASRSVQLTAQVIARRTVTINKPEVLVRWQPANVLEDEWVPAQEFRPVRSLSCSQLPAHVWQRLAAAVGRPAARHRRKPAS